MEFYPNPDLLRTTMRILAAIASDPKGAARDVVNETLYMHSVTSHGKLEGLRFVASDGHRACAITLGPVSESRPIAPATFRVPADPQHALLRDRFIGVTPNAFTAIDHASDPLTKVVKLLVHQPVPFPIDVVQEHFDSLNDASKPSIRRATLNAEYVSDGLSIVRALWKSTQLAPQFEFIWPINVERAFGITSRCTNETGLLFAVEYVVMPYKPL